MAWNLKYQINKHDRHDISWTTKIYEEDFAGDVTYFVAMEAEPAILNYCNESDDPIDPIRDQRYYVNVLMTSMFALSDLYSSEEMVLKAEVYQGSDLYLSGWVDPGKYEEAYGPVPYVARICIIDGLATLSKIKYEQSEGVPYTGHRLESQIILDVLGKIGFAVFREYINIYENSMDDGVGDSPLDQVKLNTDVFTDNDLYCDEVIKEILKSYGACIRQQGGVFNLYRPKELTGATVYGRYFTAPATKTAISYVPAQYIQRPGYATSYRQMPGSKVMIQSPAKKVTIVQDYGKKESWLDNWQFKGSTFDGTDFQGWTRGESYAYVKPIGDYIGGEDQGIAIIDTELSPVFYLHQELADVAVESIGDILILEFEYGYYNTTAAQINDVDITLQIYQGAYYLEEVDGTSMEWDNTPETGLLKITEDAPVGWTGWKAWKRQVVGFPANGAIIINLYPTEHGGDVFSCYRNIKFYVSSDQIARLNYGSAIKETQHRMTPSTVSLPRQKIVEIKEIVSRTYTKLNNINGVELPYDCLLGDVVDASIDNVIEQFAGAKAIFTDGLESAATAFVTNHAADYVTGGVIVTSSGGKIIFTSSVAGTNFSGDTAIVNTAGDLTGTVYHTVANVTSRAQIATITLSGTSGTIRVLILGLTAKIITFVTDLATTASNFAADNYDYYAANNIIVTSSGSDIIFTEITKLGGFGDVFITSLTGDLAVTLDPLKQTDGRVAVARVDEIALSGGAGTANITCDGVTEEVVCVEALSPSSVWSTRGGAEERALLQIVCDEIAAMRDRARQLVDMIIQEQTKAATDLNLLGNFQDIINIFGTNMRAFIINRGTFNVKSRTWKLDLIEIGTGGTVEEDSTTADSTDVTADNTIITVDTN